MPSTDIDSLVAIVFANTNVVFESCRVYDSDTFSLWMRYCHSGSWPHPDSLSVETANIVKCLTQDAFNAFNINVTVTDVVTRPAKLLWHCQVQLHH